ncbi:MAG: YgaP-like transmembrane domain [Syntrophomonadaceae bacterium]
MLTRDGVIARFILAFCFFFLSGTEMVTGWLAAISGTLGTVELATALLRYSPLYELYNLWHTRKE